MRKVWPHLIYGSAICLLGSACWFLWRRVSSGSSSECSENTPLQLPELERWKRTVELELSAQFDRVKSVLGRLDRQKRTEKSENGAPPGPEVPTGIDEQGALNQLLARKVHAGR